MTTTYVEQLKHDIERIRDAMRAGSMPLAERLIEIDAVTGRYAIAHAGAYEEACEKERRQAEFEGRKARDLPINYKDTALLQALTDLALHEDLTYSHPDKMSIIEYPIMSDDQYGRRKHGRHKRLAGGQQGEVPFTMADNVGTDGIDHGLPLRKPLTILDGMRIDENTSPWKRDKDGKVIG